MLDLATLKEMLGRNFSSAVQGDAPWTTAMTEKIHNQRRACALAGSDPRVYRRRSTRPLDAELRERLKGPSGERRLQLWFGREGWHGTWKKRCRIYREEGLTLRRRGGRKRAIGPGAPMAIPQGPNRRWSLDFVSASLLDSLLEGRRYHVLCVIDDFSRAAWPAVSTRRYPVSGLPVSPTTSPECAAIPAWCSATTARN